MYGLYKGKKHVEDIKRHYEEAMKNLETNLNEHKNYKKHVETAVLELSDAVDE